MPVAVAEPTADVMVKYVAEPTLRLFHDSDAFVRGIMGPFGSGKSVGMCAEIWRRSCEQAPGPDGVRRTRWGVIRNTYRELESTTLTTWREWIPEIDSHGKSFCRIKRAPLLSAHAQDIGWSDGTRVDMQVLFVSIDRPDDVKKLLSMELTGAWINEAREVPKAAVDALTGRVGRYPPVKAGGPTWRGIIMDTNPPDDDHWWFRYAEQGEWAVELPEAIRHLGRWEFFKQPGGLVKVNGKYTENPLAENIENLDGGYAYYWRLLAGKDQPFIDAHILGQYASTFTGRAVYAGLWNDAVHVSETPLGIYSGVPVLLGIDFGLTPAVIAGQLSPRGQLRILREWCCEDGGLRQFVTTVVRPALNHTFPNCPIMAAADPDGGRQRSQVDEVTCIQELHRLGIIAELGATNDVVMRREIVAAFLTRTIDGKPGFLLDPSCKVLRRGFNGGYQFERVQVTGEERYRDIPLKNRYSHPHEALSYLCGLVEKPRMLASKPRREPKKVRTGWGGFR